MFTIGQGSGMDLVRQMQKGGNLQFEFIIFDNIKRVSFWTTLGAYIYDPIHCKVITIYGCDMKSKMLKC